MPDELKAIDLNIFCEGGHYYPKPWRQNQNTYATDGRVAIRLYYPADCGEWEPPGGSKRKPPKIDDIMLPIKQVTTWHDLPEIPACEKCNNKYETQEQCDSCSGTGMCICHCEHEHDCGYCDGTGEQTECCYYKTRFTQSNRVVASVIVSKVATLPNVKWGVADDIATNAVFFRFDGGDGVFMPLNESKGKW